MVWTVLHRTRQYYESRHKRYSVTFIVVLILLLFWVSSAIAVPTQDQRAITCGPKEQVTLGNQPLLCLPGRSERAQRLSQQVQALATQRNLSVDRLQVRPSSDTEGGRTWTIAGPDRPSSIALEAEDLQGVANQAGQTNDAIAQQFLDSLKDNIKVYRLGQCELPNQGVELGSQPIFCIRTWIRAGESKSERITRIEKQVLRIQKREIDPASLGIVSADQLDPFFGISGFTELPKSQVTEEEALPMAIVSDQASLEPEDRLIVAISQLDVALDPEAIKPVELANAYLEIISKRTNNLSNQEYQVQLDWGPYQSYPYLCFRLPFQCLEQAIGGRQRVDSDLDPLSLIANRDGSINEDIEGSQKRYGRSLLLTRNEALFSVKDDLGGTPSADRAKSISKRLDDIANDLDVPSSEQLEVVVRKPYALSRKSERPQNIECDYQIQETLRDAKLETCWSQPASQQSQEREKISKIPTVLKGNLSEVAIISPKRRKRGKKDDVILTISKSNFVASDILADFTDCQLGSEPQDMICVANFQKNKIQDALRRYKKTYQSALYIGLGAVPFLVSVCIAACMRKEKKLRSEAMSMPAPFSPQDPSDAHHRSILRRIFFTRVIFGSLIAGVVLTYFYILPLPFRLLNPLVMTIGKAGARVTQNLLLYLQDDFPQLIIICLYVGLVIILLRFLIYWGLPWISRLIWKRQIYSNSQAKTTLYLLIFFVVAIAIVLASPHIPGAGTAYLAGVSAFVGLAFSISASAAIADVIAGIILVYLTRLAEGDWVKIGEVMGQIKEQNLLVHQIKTYKNTLITIPNSQVLNNLITNFSASIKDKRPDQRYFALHTTVTLGYDVPWRKAEMILKQAAGRTRRILKTPEPQVLQTGLGDFYVSYELNVYTDQPESIPKIYSELHENIQDSCIAADIEILSPHYEASRDGTEITIPSWLSIPEPHISPDNVPDQSQRPEQHNE